MAEGSGRKAARPKPKKLSQREQSERFIETARTLDVDETGKAFDEALPKIVKVRDKPES